MQFVVIFSYAFMKRGSAILLGILGIGVLIGIWMYSGYNGLVTNRENVDTQWSQVEAQYQRRFDLIPNLVNTVKGASNFEQDTLTKVTEARTKWMNAGSQSERVDAANQFDSSLSRLLVTVEAYPQLQATQAYRDLMVQLEGTENRISVARVDYNEAVRNYNLSVRRFPGSVLANIFGYEPEKFFDSTPGSEKAPTVNFGE